MARQQANAVLSDLQQLDGDLLVDAGDDDLPGARVGRAVHSDQVAVEDALVAHRVALDLEQVVRRRREERAVRSEEHTSELQSLMRISYAVFCLKKKKTQLN